MADFMRYDLEDGSEVIFETSEASLVSYRGGQPEVAEGGKLGDRLIHISKAAQEISRGLREKLGPDELELSFGIKVSGKVTWWFIAQGGGEATMAVTVRWKRSPTTDEGDSQASGTTHVGGVIGEPGQSPPAARGA